MRVSEIKVQFQVNAGPQIHAGASNKFILNLTVLTRRLFEARRLIKKIRYFFPRFSNGPTTRATLKTQGKKEKLLLQKQLN